MSSESEHHVSQPKGVSSAEKHSVLHDAALRGDLEAVQNLVSVRKLDANMRGVGGWTPLHFAARYGFLEIAQFLLGNQGKADIAAVTNRSDTALHLAAEAGHKEVVRLLIDSKASPSAQDAKGRQAGARSESAEIQGLLAANENESSSQTVSLPVLQHQLQELTRKLHSVEAEKAALAEKNKELASAEAKMKHEISEDAPLKALLISCSEFEDSSNFPAIPSVKNGREVLRKALSTCGYSFSNTFSADDATQSEFIQTITKMQKEEVCPPSSTILVYIGGHSAYDALTGQTFLVMKDTQQRSLQDSAISITQLAQEIARIPAKRKVILYDAMKHVKDKDSNRLSMREQALHELADRVRSSLILTSCKPDQISEADPSHPEPKGDSHFVACILSALTGQFGGDTLKGDSRVQQLQKEAGNQANVTANQLLEYVTIALPKRSPQQKPFSLNADTALRWVTICVLRSTPALLPRNSEQSDIR